MAETVYRGPCVGGPLNGQVGESRFPKGFLLVDKPADQVWIYDWTGTSETDGHYQVRNLVAMRVDRGKRWRAAEETEFDVVAAPWVGE